MKANDVKAQLLALADPERAAVTRRFFKTGPGEYGEGDVFVGVTSPQVRAVAREGRDLELSEVERLLDDAVHEVRACALVSLVNRFHKADEAGRRDVIEAYLRNTARINNWDLVDISCCILGEWLADKERSLLYRLAASSSMWEQRIAMVATLPLIRRGDMNDALKLAQSFLHHPHDLMHKAVGWMLREVGKYDKATLELFLRQHGQDMPRTALRYAIERFPQTERKSWLANTRQGR